MLNLTLWQRAGMLFMAALANAWVWRWLQLGERQLSLSTADLQGFGMDAVVTVGVTGLLLFVLPLSRLAAVGLAVAWAVINVAGYEYIRVFDAPPMLTYVHYLADPTFVTGSGTHVSWPWLLGGGIAWLAVATWRGPVLAWHGRVQALMAGVALCILVGWAASQAPQEWRRQHLLLVNAGEVLNGQASQPGAPAESPTMPDSLASDLGGAPQVMLPGEARNVLLVMMEGVSGAFMPSSMAASDWQSEIAMPNLDAVAAQGINYRRFLTQQRQTNRGTYSLLCGDLPKLDSSMPRMSGIADRGEPMDCLPRVLADAGYHTAYWQAAPLAFMRKDAFMTLAGFDEVKGEANLEEAYQRTSWGVDDKAFLEQSLERIRGLQEKESPWFMTLLTAGTHHPYNVPDGAESSGDERQQAFAYLDSALHEFVKELESLGVRDDTLILITTDESSGISGEADDWVRQLSQNWGMMVALLPDGEADEVTAPYAQYDVPLSVLDYLGLAGDSGPFMGRSLFREYATSRPMFMANTYARYQYALEEDRLVACQEGPDACRDFRYEVVDRVAVMPHDGEEYEMLRSRLDEAVAYSRRPSDEEPQHERLHLMPAGTLELEGREGNQVLFGGQAWEFPAGTRLEVELEVAVEEGSEVTLLHSLLDAERGFHHADIPVLDKGEAHALSYEVTFDEDVQGVNANLTVEQGNQKPARLSVEQARISVTRP